MFCRKCGAQIDTGMRFCSSCGEVVSGEPTTPTNQFTVSSPSDNGQFAPKVNHKKIGMAACAIVLLIVIIGAIVIFTQSGNDNLDRRLVGRWEWTEWAEDWIEFRRDGSGSRMWWGVEETLTWETENNSRLRIRLEGERGSWFPYEIDGDILRMIDQWGDIWEYRKVR